MADKLISLCENFVTERTQLTTTFEDIRTILDVDNTSGVWLDIVGTIVGEAPRLWSGVTPAISDTDYRVLIKNRIALNSGNGTMEDVIRAIRRFLLDAGSTPPTDMITTDNANIFVDYPDDLPESANDLKEKLVSLRDKCGHISDFVAAGIGLYVYAYFHEPFTIYESGDGLIGVGIDNGFGIGGRLSTIIGWK